MDMGDRREGAPYGDEDAAGRAHTIKGAAVDVGAMASSVTIAEMEKRGMPWSIRPCMIVRPTVVVVSDNAVADAD